jgi:nucleotide-binding universal stress UspA family protein
METTDRLANAVLSLDNLVANPRLARRFPAEFARRFHAVPVAEQDGQVTVAMADPDDQEARAAVLAVLGLASCVVRVDPVTIDALIGAVWNGHDPQRLRMLICTYPRPVAGAFADYAHQLGDLLGARLDRLDTLAELRALRTEAGAAQYDLVLFDTARHPLLHRLLAQRVERPAADRPREPGEQAVPFAALVAGRPCWPIDRILLIVWGDDADEAAIDWMLRLARASGGTVTALAVVPQVPAMYGRPAGMVQGLPMLLTTSTPMGRRMRQTARHLVGWEIPGTLRLRQGSPDWQIRRELVEGDYDLVVLAARPRRHWQRWLEGDLLCPLLRWTDRPVLIATPPGT